ncbi:MAG: hypothetical protein AAF654_00585 [Myxococcota bacterium]
MTVLAIVVLMTQSGSDGDAEEARQLFEQARVALETADHAAAKRLLEKALALHPNPSIAFNLSMAEGSLGLYVESVTRLRAIEAGRYGALTEEALGDVRLRREKFAKRIAKVTLDVDGFTESVEIVGHGAVKPGAPTPLNPGRYTARAASSSASVETEFALGDGEQRTVRIELRAVAPPPTEAPPEERSSYWSSPWLWGSVALVAATSVGVLLILDDEEPVGRPMGPVIETN